MGRYYLLLGLLLLSISMQSQVITGFDDEDKNLLLLRALPDTARLNKYYDSLYKQLNTKLLTGYTVSSYREPLSGLKIEYSFTGFNFTSTTTDYLGRFFIPLGQSSSEYLHLRINDIGYQAFDTIIKQAFIQKKHLSLVLSPRYRIVLRGRLFVGSLATENINVTIIHNSDTSKHTTLECFVDDENYWNCLYRGMFKQTINFDNPEDTVTMIFQKQGFLDQTLSMKVSEYDGSIIPVKLEYSDELMKFPRQNIALKYSPPFSNAWSVALNYMHIFKFGNFNRLALGFESKMLITDIETEIPTFPNVSSSDSAFLSAHSDSSYSTGMFTPQISLWLTDPRRRFFSVYAGIGFPYAIPKNKFYFQPYIGSRFYLDLNKALLIELKYVNYEIDIVKYEFNSYANAYRSATNESYNRLMFNLGLLVSF